VLFIEDDVEQKIPFHFIQSFTRDGVTRKTLTSHLPIMPLDAELMREIEERSVQAQRYVATAIREFRTPEAVKHLEKWYGQNFTDGTVERVGELLNNLDAMLSNVHYIYPGPTCEEKTFAYVYGQSPFFSRHKDGKYIFYLCELFRTQAGWTKSFNSKTITPGTKIIAHFYKDDKKSADTDEGVLDGYVDDKLEEVKITFQDGVQQVVKASWVRRVAFTGKQSPSVQIETLTHEGSHHQPSETDDVCIDGTDDCDDDDDKAYGRKTCETLATEHPAAALRNADNLCYFVNDMNGDFER
jgi:hypothetical protein